MTPLNSPPPQNLTGFGLAPGELRLEIVGPEWAHRFAEERRRLAAALGSGALDIQHIGSTALVGITAKPILDIAIAIRDFAAGTAFVPALVALGYTYRGENGIPRRHFYLREGTHRTHHLHIFEQDSENWHRHLRFRDRLLKSPELLARYAEIKIAAAGQAKGNRELYQDLKASFIEEFQKDENLI